MSKYECCYDVPRDFSVIRKRIAEKYKYEYEFAAELGMNKQTFSRKLHSITAFTVSEILKICELLEISESEIEACFRTPQVPETRPIGIRTKIRVHYGNEAALARKIGMPKNTLCQRLNFKIDFRYSELLRISEALGISMSETVELIEEERRQHE